MPKSQRRISGRSVSVALGPATALSLAIVACSGSSPTSEFAGPAADAGADRTVGNAPMDGGANDANGLDLANYYDRYAVIGCQKSFDCCTSHGDDATIAQNWQGAVTSRAGCDGAVPPSALAADESDALTAIESGTVVYHPEFAQACLDAMSALSCDRFFDDPELYTPAPCLSLFEGELALGATCQTGIQCPGGDGCIGPLSGPSTCQTIPQQGQPCTGFCPAHLYCDESAARPTCVPQLAEGSHCDPSQLECQGVCDFASTTCGPPFAKACEGNGVCTPSVAGCVGNAVASCSDAGQWGVASPCTDQSCVNGACVGTCVAGSTRCSGNAVESCAADGQWSAPVSCANQTCVDGTCMGSCQPDAAAACQGDQPLLCNASGSWESSGPACAQPAPDCDAGSCTCAGAVCGGVCVDVQTDKSNCGGCGTPCAGTCSGGRCTVALATGQLDPYAIVTDGAAVYWTNYGASPVGSVYEVSVTGGTPTQVVASAFESWSIALAPPDLYFVNGSDVDRVSTAGAGLTAIAAGVNAVGITVGNGNVYFAAYSTGNIESVPLGGLADGGAPKVLASANGAGSTWGIAVDATNVYWTLSHNGTTTAPAVQEGPLAGDGGAGVTLANGSGWGIAVDAANVYWTTDGGGTVVQSPIGGGAAVTLASNQANPRALVVDATSVYWANSYGGTVMKVPIGGGALVTLASGQGSVQGIAVDATSVYWTSAGSGSNTGAVYKVTPK